MTDEEKLEAHWGHALVHESGHALMAVLQEISYHAIAYDKTALNFCTLTELPPESEYSEKHYFFRAAGSAAELVIYGHYDEVTAKSDRLPFQNTGAPSVQDTLNEARTLLLGHETKVKQMVSQLKAKCLEVDLNMLVLRDVSIVGSDHKFGVLLTSEELKDAVR
jgi:hypothetical protein